ncbi:MAG TPA: hypothetical protein VFC63_06275 [Blastocatellia bacterium]|nr:hypothetical protein [Blastocatellia bacterium]
MSRSRTPIETEPVPGSNPSESQRRPGERSAVPNVESHADSPPSGNKNNALGETDSENQNGESDIQPFLG